LPTFAGAEKEKLAALWCDQLLFLYQKLKYERDSILVAHAIILRMEQTDAELIQATIDGDAGAFSVLVGRYSRDVYGFVFFMAKNVSDAEDITQETFVKVWKNLKKFKPEQRFKSWLMTIARNTTIDYIRKRRHAVFSDFDDEEGSNAIVETLADDERLADEIASIAESAEQTTEAVSKLSDIYRSVLALRYESGLSFEEISKILKKPVNTVKSQHRRALIALRKIVTDESAPKNKDNAYINRV
jgi:RNA polymerase sigma-70 factor (ECF subfamily)